MTEKCKYEVGSEVGDFVIKKIEFADWFVTPGRYASSQCFLEEIVKNRGNLSEIHTNKCCTRCEARIIADLVKKNQD